MVADRTNNRARAVTYRPMKDKDRRYALRIQFLPDVSRGFARVLRWQHCFSPCEDTTPLPRHCEERSDEAIQMRRGSGLLRLRLAMTAAATPGCPKLRSR